MLGRLGRVKGNEKKLGRENIDFKCKDSSYWLKQPSSCCYMRYEYDIGDCAIAVVLMFKW